VERWLRRERDWINENDLYEISIELAVTIFTRQHQGWGDRISAEFLDGLAKLHNSSISSWKLKSRSLLNRDIEGNFKFAHRSVMEFLVVVASLRGDERALAVEWTDLMKDLLVSLANTDAESERKTLELLKKDLTETKVFPLATSVSAPRRLASSELKRTLKNEEVSHRHSRVIPVAWRNLRYEIKCVAKTNEVSSYLINDQTHGLSWLVNDISKLMEPAERALYEDRFTESSSVPPQLSQLFGHRLRASYRHPSIEELLTLWESEPYIQKQYGLSAIFDRTATYWLGDRVEEAYLCCSFGADPMIRPELRHIDTRTDSLGRRLHLYELLGKYGIVNREPYRAICTYIIDEVSELVA
jgi:hypothetical protein